MSKSTFTDQLRARVLKRLKAEPCPTCGHVEFNSRAAAKQTGVPYATLFRFAKGIREPSAKVINQLVAWLGK